MTDAVFSWLYVSSSRLSAAREPDALAGIVALSRSRNVLLDVTGALMFTGTRFIQFIEGPADSVRTLQASIRADPRHKDIRTLSQGPIGARCFWDWSLAYAGPSHYVSAQLEQAIRMIDAESASGVMSIIELLQEFAG